MCVCVCVEGVCVQYLLACRNLRKQSVKWVGYKQKKWSDVFFVFLYRPYHYKEPSSLHTAPWDPTMHCTVCVCVCVHVSPFSCLFHPSPHSLPWLLLTLVCPDKPFMLKQFRALGKHLFYISTRGDLTQTDSGCIQLGLTKDMYTRAGSRWLWMKNNPWKFDPDWPVTTTPLLYFSRYGRMWRELEDFNMWRWYIYNKDNGSVYSPPLVMLFMCTVLVNTVSPTGTWRLYNVNYLQFMHNSLSLSAWHKKWRLY